MKRLALILFLAGRVASLAAGADGTVVDDLIKQAKAAVVAGKFDDAVHLYDQVLIGHPEASNHWFEAQLGIAQALAKKGDFAEAAKAAHLALDGAPTLQTFDAAVIVTANILSAQDKTVERANQFLTFEQTGPVGGATNPLEAVGYPSQPEREAAFATLRQQGEGNGVDSRTFAMTYLFTGKPKDALAQFADAVRRSTPTSLPRANSDLILIGLRAARGYRANLDQAVQFMIYGVNGPDHKPGTPDDLPDPFAGLLPAPPASGNGGLAQYSADDLAALHQVQNAAQLYWDDSLLASSIRQQALSALIKTTSALDGWGKAGQKDQYLQSALGVVPNEQTRALLVYAAAMAAQGRNLDFGPIQIMWAEIDQERAGKNLPDLKGLEDSRRQFQTLCDALNRVVFPKLAYKPLVNPGKF